MAGWGDGGCGFARWVLPARGGCQGECALVMHPDSDTGEPGTGLAIRGMVESDLDRVMAIAASLATAPQWTRGAYEVAIASGDGPRRIALATERSGEVIGFVVVRAVVRMAEIETIAIAGNGQG